jgi:hypothetical protein
MGVRQLESGSQTSKRRVLTTEFGIEARTYGKVRAAALKDQQ